MPDGGSRCVAGGMRLLRFPRLKRYGLAAVLNDRFQLLRQAVGRPAVVGTVLGALSLIFLVSDSGPRPGDPSRPVPDVQFLPPVSSQSTIAPATATGTPPKRGGLGVRYGVIVQSPESPSGAAYAEGLGVRWFLNEGHSPALNIGSSRKVPIIKEIKPATYLSREQMAQLLQDHPGVDIVLGNEPNVGAQGNSTGAQYAEAFHYYNDLLKGEGGLDPSRRLVAGNTLNWEFTCLRRAEGIPESHGCAWDYSGREFVTEFRATYKLKFGTEPPVEVWGIHSYPVNWKKLPTTDSGIAIEQIAAMRRYLDSSLTHTGTPIWVTEFGLHWGFNCGNPCLVEKRGLLAPGPGSEYREAEVLDYMDEMIDWLESRAAEDRIEKWFLYAAYVALGEGDTQVNQGLTLYQGPDPSHGLSAIGELYKRRAAAQ